MCGLFPDKVGPESRPKESGNGRQDGPGTHALLLPGNKKYLTAQKDMGVSKNQFTLADFSGTLDRVHNHIGQGFDMYKSC